LREYDAECNRKFCEGKAYPAWYPYFNIFYLQVT
jgi:hypothetical protein